MNHEKEFIKKFNSISGRHSRYQVFHDWVTMASSALIVRGCPSEAERSEAEYMAIVPKYNRDELQIFSELLSITAMALIDEPQDFLGSVFMQSELGNDRMGQFFTPYSLSYAIAEMMIHDIDVSKDLVTVSEPACGSGGMVIAFCEAARKRGISPQWQTYTIATDLSEVAARMAYIQLSLSGIPAHVVWGNTISLQVFREWSTFAFWPIAHKVARWRLGNDPEPPKPPTSINLQPKRLVQAEMF